MTSLLPLLAVAVMTGLSGCYYGHLAAGQTRLLWASRSIEAVLEDPETSDPLRARLVLVRAATRFADELGLEVGGQYSSYVAFPGDRVITTVVATRPGELEPAGFSFPLLGRLPYKGFFELERAESQADKLRKRGLDVCLSAVTAYSTLGWLNDPITEPMLQTSDGRLVETIVHELVHATVYAKNEPEFNESIATFIGQEASVAFFREPRPGTPAPAGPDSQRPRSAEAKTLAEAERARVHDARLVARVLGQFRRDVASLYASHSEEPEEPEAAAGAGAAKRSLERAALEKRVRSRLAQLPLEGASREDAVRLAERVRLNDACLALQATYGDDLDRHGEVLAALGGDLAALIAQLRAAALSDDPRGNFFGLTTDP